MKPSPASATAEPTRPERILVRTTNWLGDTVMSLPAIQRLHELHPEAHISVLCHAKLQQLWRHNPFVREVLTFQEHPTLSQLRRHQFDLALILPNSFRAAWECFGARIPRRVGFAGHHRRWLLTDVVAETRAEHPRTGMVEVLGQQFPIKVYEQPRHQAHRYLDLISYLGGHRDLVQPKIWVAPGEAPSLSKFLRGGSRPFCGINAGAEYGPAKRWLPERFVEAALRIGEEYPCQWLVFGGVADQPLAETIASQLQARLASPTEVINLAGQTSLSELCELIQFCRLLLTNDTGPMHLAAALGTPLVALFGSTCPELTGPLGPHCAILRGQAECAPCFLRQCPVDFRCMHSITTDQVVTAALQMLANTEPAHDRSIQVNTDS